MKGITLGMSIILILPGMGITGTVTTMHIIAVLLKGNTEPISMTDILITNVLNMIGGATEARDGGLSIGVIPTTGVVIMDMAIMDMGIMVVPDFNG